MKILITGIAGFIGSHLAKLLAEQNYDIIGIDNLNNYYDIQLKYNRLNNLCGINENILDDLKIYNSKKYNNLSFIKMDLLDKINIDKLFNDYKFDKVINLAAQAGVRYSIEHPYEYINSNIIGFMNIIEACKTYNVKTLIYASSSSVYGLNDFTPFSENDKSEQPASLYAATKKSDELISHVYSHLYNLQTIGLRFFTVYGPYGRPDMAPMLFANAIKNNEQIKVFNNGNMQRDFTYIDDIIKGVLEIVKKNVDEKYKIYNIGRGNPVNLLDFIRLIEKELKKSAQKLYMPIQSGDVQITYASTEKLEKDYNYKPTISIEEGVHNFIEWFKTY